MQEKQDNKRKIQEREKEIDLRVMEQYSHFYKFGKNGRVGGGNPIRDTDGNITAEYGAFNA
jgi:hypothetical protein